MPRKTKQKTTDDTRKNLLKAIRRYAKARVEDSWAGSQPPEEAAGLEQAVTAAAELVSHAIFDFEQAIRAELSK